MRIPTRLADRPELQAENGEKQLGMIPLTASPEKAVF